MSTVRLSPIIIDKALGHKIYRKTTEEFQAYCGLCKQNLTFISMEPYTLTWIRFQKHIREEHEQNLQA